MSNKRLQEHKTQTEHLLRKRKVTKQAAAHNEPKQMRLQMDIAPSSSSVAEPDTEFNDEEQETIALCEICLEEDVATDTDDEMAEDDSVSDEWVMCEKVTCQKWYHIPCVKKFWPQKKIGTGKWFCC